MNQQFFSHRTFPILQYVEKQELPIPPMENFYPEDVANEGIRQVIEFVHFGFRALMLKEAGSNIRYVSKPFWEAISKAYDQMADDSLLQLEEPVFGVLLLPNKMQYVYYIEKRGNDTDYVIFQFNERVIVSIWYRDGGKDYFSWVSPHHMNWVKQEFQHRKVGIPDPRHVLMATYRRLVAILNFIKYAEIETRELAPRQKVREVNCRYFNDTKRKITVLDSRWFTNLISSNAFKVNGHFRLQPFGEGRKDRKLIWINEFQKSGYTSQAKKLKEGGEV